MPSIELSERVYEKAEKAAASSGVSVEMYVEQYLEAGLNEALILTPEQEAKVLESLEDVRAGRTVTLDVAFARLDARKEIYLAENPR